MDYTNFLSLESVLVPSSFESVTRGTCARARFNSTIAMLTIQQHTLTYIQENSVLSSKYVTYMCIKNDILINFCIFDRLFLWIL